MENKVSDRYLSTDGHGSATHAIQKWKSPAPPPVHKLDEQTVLRSHSRTLSALESDATTCVNTHQEKEATDCVLDDSRTGRSTATDSKLVVAAEGRRGVWG